MFRLSLPSPGRARCPVNPRNPTLSWHAAATRDVAAGNQGEAPKALWALTAAFPRRAGTRLLQGEPQGLSPECPLAFVFKAARCTREPGSGKSAQLAVLVGRGPGKALYQHCWSPECIKCAVLAPLGRSRRPGAALCGTKGPQLEQNPRVISMHTPVCISSDSS